LLETKLGNRTSFQFLLAMIGVGMIEHVRRLALLALAVVLVAVGLVTFFLPIPLGVLPLLIGLAILMALIPRLRRWFLGLRRRYPSLDAGLTSIEPHLPSPLRKILRPENR